MLCVLLGHALVVFMLIRLTRPVTPDVPAAPVATLWLQMPRAREAAPAPEPAVEPGAHVPLAVPTMPAVEGDLPGEDTVSPATRDYVDWPRESRDAAARELARQAESERIARLFAGPQGTWASLTKRQQSELDHFRWAPGVDGLERDEKGNTIYTLPNGCRVVNFQSIGCPIGKKPPAYGDLFKDMRLYFDERRRPESREGNGREPESMRPPKWSKPLP